MVNHAHHAMGLQDVWRKVYPDPGAVSEVGPTREHRRIDRIWLTSRVADLVQFVDTTPVGGANHTCGGCRLPGSYRQGVSDSAAQTAERLALSVPLIESSRV